MNIPNILTVIRIILVPVFVIFLIRGSFLSALVVFVVAGITDALDGFLARVLNQQTVLGAYLDPIADKALVATSFVSLSIMGFIPGWLAVIVISRDSIILLGILLFFILSVSFEMKPAFVSKLTTVFQILTVVFVLLFQCFPRYAWDNVLGTLIWSTAVVTVISGLYYIRVWFLYAGRGPRNNE
ncbi:MAG: CDP-alcohol phosphatidyltransferase family protein [Deltaproteobacteria bacterium]|nr:CDP-alcohol phosphatidyltransferase family protein [Deltaproteobacteria bacterium]